MIAKGLLARAEAVSLGVEIAAVVEALTGVVFSAGFWALAVTPLSRTVSRISNPPRGKGDFRYLMNRTPIGAFGS